MFGPACLAAVRRIADQCAALVIGQGGEILHELIGDFLDPGFNGTTLLANPLQFIIRCLDRPIVAGAFDSERILALAEVLQALIELAARGQVFEAVRGQQRSGLRGDLITAGGEFGDLRCRGVLDAERGPLRFQGPLFRFIRHPFAAPAPQFIARGNAVLLQVSVARPVQFVAFGLRCG